MKPLGLGSKSSLLCVEKFADPYNEVKINGIHLVKAIHVLGFSDMGHVLPLQANYVKSNFVFHKKRFS